MNRFMYLLKALCLLSGTFFLVLLSVVTLEFRSYTLNTVQPMLNKQSASITALLNTVNETSSFNSKKLDIMATNIVALTGDADDAIEQIRGALVDDKFGVLPQASELIVSANRVVNDADKVTDTLNTSIAATAAKAQDALAPVPDTLADAQSLLEAGTVQLHINGVASAALLGSLDKTVKDGDALVSDPEIKETIAHVDSSVDSIDIALKPWRKRVTLLKQIVSHVAQAILNNAAFLVLR